LEPVIHAHEEAHASHALEWGLMAVSVSVASLGVFLAYLMYRRESLSPAIFANLAGGSLYRLFDRKWYFDEIYQAVFVNGTLLIARLGSLFDQYIIDGIVNLIANVTFDIGNKLRRVQTGNINSYLYGILIAVVLLIIAKLRYAS
jgi:NADH-quinone oxidoreductase subunit L